MLKFSEEHATIKSMSVNGATADPDGNKLAEVELTLQIEVSERLWKGLDDIFPGADLVSKRCAALAEDEGAHGDTRSTKRDLGEVALTINYDGKKALEFSGARVVKTIKLKTLTKPAGQGLLVIKVAVKATDKQLSKMAQYVGADCTCTLDPAQMDLLGATGTDDVATVHHLHG